MSKPALGRGLGALLGGLPAGHPSPADATHSTVSQPGATGEAVQKVAWGTVRPCAFQPRKDFPSEALRELADSIREQGIVQPSSSASG
jgi:ParB family transcriptional regulator, chromosome partitioning protein